MVFLQRKRGMGVILGIGFCLLSISGALAFTSKSLAPDPSPQAVNQALGIPLFSETNFWEESAPSVAARLGLNTESRTSVESGYRLYPGADAIILGVRPFSIFLQGVGSDGGKAARFSLIFANKGDVGVYASATDRRRAEVSSSGEILVTPQMLQAYQGAIRHDGDQLKEALSALLGPSVPATLGISGMEERGERWDWRGSSFILSSPRNEYVALRILPTKTLEDQDAERHSFTAAKAMIPKRVIHRPNGDVVITDLPMVDQGAKGYCVPATYERVLRYYGLSADMNLLAMAGQTEAGGGTSMEKIALAAYELVREAGGRITSGVATERISDIAPYIDKGEPLLWALYSSDDFNERIGSRMAARDGVIDTSTAEEWSAKVLPSARAAARTLPRKGAHVCLIIGYNPITREIAISDSWGPEFTERWVTQEEVQSVGQGESTVIGW